MPTASAVETLIGQRRWRILQNAQPLFAPAEPVPAWIRTPEQFVEWLSMRARARRNCAAYFRDLEEIARQSCDLELLRFRAPLSRARSEAAPGIAPPAAWRKGVQAGLTQGSLPAKGVERA